mgnify:CR=1 FL=1
MRLMRDGFQAHRTAALLAGAVWLVLWGITAATWLYDPDGLSSGMHPLVFAVHLAAPLFSGVLAGSWQAAPGAGLKAGALTGALFAASNMILLIIWSGLLFALGHVDPPEVPVLWWEGVLEVLHLGVTYVILGALLGLLGGVGGAALLHSRR